MQYSDGAISQQEHGFVFGGQQYKEYIYNRSLGFTLLNTHHTSSFGMTYSTSARTRVQE